MDFLPEVCPVATVRLLKPSAAAIFARSDTASRRPIREAKGVFEFTGEIMAVAKQTHFV
ncbi:MAG TPA: hypothetical protein VLV88_09435 [Terriglobales bacterium]|nr:hypothetical protein [Terriglobales bacterium]